MYKLTREPTPCKYPVRHYKDQGNCKQKRTFRFFFVYFFFAGAAAPAFGRFAP